MAGTIAADVTAAMADAAVFFSDSSALRESTSSLRRKIMLKSTSRSRA